MTTKSGIRGIKILDKNNEKDSKQTKKDVNNCKKLKST